jgi:hypothetical protein
VPAGVVDALCAWHAGSRYESYVYITGLGDTDAFQGFVKKVQFNASDSEKAKALAVRAPTQGGFEARALQGALCAFRARSLAP